MYLEYWGFNKYPFENVPDPDFMYHSTEHDEALVRLHYAVIRKKGAALLTGEIGSGKTLLSRVFIQSLPEKDFEIGLITNPSLEPIDFLKEILYQLGIDSNTDSKTAIINSLNTKLLENSQKNIATLLIVDEAQLVPPDSLEEIRLLLNFQLNDQFLMTFILIGQPELKDMIRKYKQLDQRIAIRYHLNALNLEDTARFIAYRVEKAGSSNTEIFTPDAIDMIYQYSEGIPRKINNVCDLSLLISFSMKGQNVDLGVVRKVIKDSL